MVSEMESVNKNSASHPISNAAYLSNNNVAPQPLPVQTVGVEFVRQYYTMLNKAPHLLFRDDSTFFHGCLDKPGETQQYVRGQKQINTKIMSLNFKNCHTKIRHVDSMETIGNGVVIQVIGELSNNGQPLRHFLQTFVLTPHGSPNKYYVRNDIFRYQDETYFEENEDHAEKCEVETKIETATIPPTAVVEPPQIPTSGIEKEMTYQPSNGSLGNAGETIASLEETVPPEPKLPPVVDNISEAKDLSPELSEVKKIELEETDNGSSSFDTSGGSSTLANEPKTYANMVSKSYANSVQGSSGVTASRPPINNELPPVPAINYQLEPISPSPVVNASAPTNKGLGMPPQREPRFPKKSNFNRRNESRDSGKNDSDSGDGDHYLSGQKKHPDENQLFIGNLLPEFGEEDLIKIFQKFGKIVDVRINRQSHKMGSGKSGRNYGFITFEDPKVVDSVIAQKPIFHDNHRYNVEKKQGKSSSFSRSNQPPSSNSPRNVTGSVSTGSAGGGLNIGSRGGHPPANSSGGSQGNSTGQRPRPSSNFNAPNASNNRNLSSGGANFVGGRSNFTQQQQNR